MPTWEITCYDSTEELWTKRVPVKVSEGQIITMLQRLVCMDLTADEIIGASLPARAKFRNRLLECVRYQTPISLGESPYYVAKVVDD